MAFGMSAASAALVGSVAAPIVGGLFSSNSASNAANTQSQSTDKAIAEQQRQYDTSRSDLAPYRQAGTAALSRLQFLLGIPGGGGGNDASSIAARIRQALPGFDRDRPASEDDAAFVKHFANNAPVLLSQNPFGYDQKMMDDIRSVLPDAQNFDPSAATNSGDGYGSLLKKFSSADLNADPIYKNALDFSTEQGTRALNARAAASGSYDSGQALKELARFTQGNAAALGGDAYSRYNTDQNNVYGRLSGIAGMGQGATTTGVSAGNNTAGNLAGLYTGQGNASAAAGIAGGNAISGGLTSAANNYGQYNLLQQLTGGGARALASPTGSAGTGID